MVWILKTEAEGNAIRELGDTPDRVAAIVGASILEDRIQTAIAKSFQPAKSIHKDMFRPSGPLGSFSVKIDMAFLLGIYSEEARQDIMRIKDIRNAFAHKIEVKDFAVASMRDLAMALTIVERHVHERGRTSDDFPGVSPLMFVPRRDEQLANPRQRFLLSVMFFVSALTPIAQFPPVLGRRPPF